MPTQSTRVDVIVHWKHFRRYFTDAASFVSDALESPGKDHKSNERQRRMTRSAIAFSALALESAANCCLDALRLPKDSFEDFEKLPTLAKFDLFLTRVNGKQLLDREHVLVRPIRNLISCRNEFVHSKVRKEQAQAGRVEPKIWLPLGLPHNSDYWQPLHAVKCFTVLADFLNYFFFELCGYPIKGIDGRNRVAFLLGGAVEQAGQESLPGGVTFAPVQDNGDWADCMAVAKNWDLDLAFMPGITTRNNQQVHAQRKWGDYTHCQVEKLTIPWKHLWYPVPGGLQIISVGKPEQAVKTAKGKPKN